jgi:hypothetical protein
MFNLVRGNGYIVTSRNKAKAVPLHARKALVGEEV